MKRTSKIERLYSLGDYKNIKFEDIIDEIPIELFSDAEFMRNLRKAQLLSIELAYRHYISIIENTPFSMQNEKAIETLISMQEKVYSKLFTNGKDHSTAQVPDNNLEN